MDEDERKIMEEEELQCRQGGEEEEVFPDELRTGLIGQVDGNIFTSNLREEVKYYVNGLVVILGICRSFFFLIHRFCTGSWQHPKSVESSSRLWKRSRECRMALD